MNKLSLFLLVISCLPPGAPDPLLPPGHLPFHLKENGHCWGYEQGCEKELSYSQDIVCETEFDPHNTKKLSRDIFFDEADFGYVRQRLSTMQSICEPLNNRQSSLVCSKNLQFCSGRNILIDFSNLPQRATELLRYSMDVLNHGQILGQCLLHQERLNENMAYMAPLQSWAPELKNFVAVNTSLNEICDVTIDRPTFILKIDAAVNFYHHFCDFFNLYASLHINSSRPDEMFNQDVHILIWENRAYQSNFASAFEAFTSHPIWDLNTFGGKKVCFKNLVLPLPPRMIFGLYYNTPLFSNCRNSGLFHAFSHFMSHRLGIQRPQFTDSLKIRVTIINRLTQYRQILNLETLVKSLREKGGYEVTVADFSHRMSFKQQLNIVANTDVLVGIHGAGLTHMLFLPDWATVFELYHCEDQSCYKELARLRGINYITWSNPDTVYPEDEGHHPSDSSKGHAKFTNYAFDAQDFVRHVDQASGLVRSHPAFRSIDRKRNSNNNKVHTEL